ncbi:MAG: metal ABC transporter ATP-binding protein [Lachnospiraceae bacterium]|nr:metal ABC transporter ATP-binding protein [Lachnospiraceae bacterium]
MAYITCENLLLGYDGVPVAKDISFTVNEGDYLCIIGENGAGKSTLMKTLLHLTTPLGGSFSMGDGIKPYEIGYLPQQTVVQKDFPASVWEIVMSGTLSKGGFRPFYSKEQKKLAMDNLKRMGIENLKDECYRNLSGGQQQRVLLARALCAASKILLLDEPVTGLDPKAMTEFYQLIASLNDEGIAVIMVSHDLHAAIKYATHILHVEPEDSFFGTKEEYLESDEWKQMKEAGGVKRG